MKKIHTSLGLASALAVGCSGAAPPPAAPPAEAASPAQPPAPANTAAPVESPASEPRRLRVALYPYVPDYKGMKELVTAAFKKERPHTALELVDLGNYYKPAEKDSIVQSDAHVIEIDSVFLDDLLPSLQPLPASVGLNEADFHPAAVSVGKKGDGWVALPHWLCSNFLFTTRDAAPRLKTFSDLQRLAKASLPAAGLLVDLMGSSTLGELYFDAQVDAAGDVAKALPAGDPLAVGGTPGLKALLALRGLCAGGVCRSDSYHDDPSMYGRLMARKRGVALVGYSEILNAFVDEARKKCDGAPCLDEGALEVLPFALSDRGDKPFVWVDSLGVKSSCTGDCLEDAAAFLAMMNRDDLLRAALIPEGSAAPRYLMPAKQTLSAALDKAAPYYAKLRPIVAGAAAARGPKLGATLRAIGGKIDDELAKAAPPASGGPK
ncbi:hypothetical protein [Sorangium sp. So ce131]|uniref:hypothetical protein n=1 Tax=Sorangium sp. So ce131 TaxID=3133282 RepID=UPI003F60BFD4